MKLSSLRPQYLVPRVRQIAFQRRHPDAPWLGEAAIRFLEAWLRPTDVGIEWGSGRSTAWIAARVARLTSVEGDAQWHRVVSARLAERHLAHVVDYRHVPCGHGEQDEPQAHPYAGVAEEMPDESLDFAVVDGMIRETCMRVALPKIKPGGLLVLDNANRYFPNPSLGEYATVHQPCREPPTQAWANLARELQPWRWVLTTDRLWDTRFWVKPQRRA
jgi:hypothetical protein